MHCRPSREPIQSKDALAAFDAFVETWGVKYDKAIPDLHGSGTSTD
jgi:hypothetical protein